MSEQSKRPRSGEFANLTSQRAKDGTLEYVLGDEDSSPLEEPVRPAPAKASSAATHSTSHGTSRKPMIAALVALVALVVVAGAFFLSPDDEPIKEAEEQVSFKAYSGSQDVIEEEPAPKKRVVVVDDEIPEELAGWDLDEHDEEVIVIEEYAGDEEPAAAVAVQQVKPKEEGSKHERTSLAEFGRKRHGSPEQRQLLRQFNEQLDRGERPVIPKANIPARMRPMSPRVQGQLDHVAGPRFVPGKLQLPNKK